jgi:phosphatidylethanolamine-binding protein (PEBP) family uncharacterized protein
MSKIEGTDMRTNTTRRKWSQLRSQQRSLSSDWFSAPYPPEEHRGHHVSNTVNRSATDEQSSQAKVSEFKRLLH